VSDSLYLGQVVILGVVTLWFTRGQRVLQLQILGWMLLSSSILLRYGLVEQQNFYSNDQRYHSGLVNEILGNGLPFDLDWWLSAARVPYVLPASLLAAMGIEPLLALKFISLLALLATTSLIQRRVPTTAVLSLAATTYLSATAVIGVFFAALGLRDTTMMLLVLWFFTSTSTAAKIGSLICLVLLRPHLAAAVLIGSLLALVAQRWQRNSTTTPLANFLGLATGPILGYYTYSLGIQYQYGRGGIFGHTWGISPVLRIASNYVGLQFLTVPASTVEFSTTSLLLLRVLLSETIVIALLFTISVVLARRQSLLMQSVMWSFGIYVGIVTNTDFNSFRQNVPFMPAMGLVVLLAWREHQLSRNNPQSQALTARRET